MYNCTFFSFLRSGFFVNSCRSRFRIKEMHGSVYHFSVCLNLQAVSSFLKFTCCCLDHLNIWKLKFFLLYLLNWIILDLLSCVGCKMLQKYLAWWLRTTNVCNLTWEPTRKQISFYFKWGRVHMCLLSSITWCSIALIE